MKINLYNLGIQQGKVSNLEIITDGNRFLKMFYLSNDGLKIACFIYDTLAKYSNFKNGDFVSVHGHLRYSTNKDSYKIMVNAISKLDTETTSGLINMIILEGFIKKMQITETLNLDFRHYALNKSGEGYTLPLGIVFKNGRASYVKDIVEIDKPYMVEGTLQGNTKDGYYLIGTHIKCTIPVEIKGVI